MKDIIDCGVDKVMKVAKDYARKKVILELEMICAKYAIEIGKEGEDDYQVEISMHEVFERLEELRQQ